eukprot:NODE_3908_length_717_cov_16.323353_g3299_i0.p3 GENE.NODE_3908_length_717_cov_16.323353_g3299_i0~~NODE_3908_length_717_cov_16.323353_g3299_i0.p3  ORF type:complete len:56 (-),score=3.39 NODE_3908_length_717_cov_16.323353_g3299_i0:474-641(-)
MGNCNCKYILGRVTQAPKSGAPGVKKADFLKATKSLSNPAIEAIIYSGHQKDWVP